MFSGRASRPGLFYLWRADSIILASSIQDPPERAGQTGEKLTLQAIVYGLVCLLLAYISGLLLRYVWLGVRRKRKDPLDLTDTGDEGSELLVEPVHTQILGGEPGKSFSSVHYDSAAPVEIEDERPEPRLSRPMPPDASEFGFDALLEMRQMRVKLDETQQQFTQLQKEVDALRDELAEVRALSQVSPVYGDAVSLARRGYDPQFIAERCGISVAEAELVRSLSGSAEEQEEGNAGS